MRRLGDAAGRPGRPADHRHITEHVDTATQVTFKVLANPVIKGAAIAVGYFPGRGPAACRERREGLGLSVQAGHVVRSRVAAGVGGTVWRTARREADGEGQAPTTGELGRRRRGRVGDVVRDAVAEGCAGVRT
jgi:hypothetical protein